MTAQIHLLMRLRCRASHHADACRDGPQCGAASFDLKGHAHTGLDIMEQEDMLISGHPVAWDIERGAKSRELLVILHKRGYDTEHWAARLDRASQRVTHVSAGPLLRTVEFKPEVRLLWDAQLEGSAEAFMLMLPSGTSHNA